MQSPAWNDDFDATVGEQDPWYDWDLAYPSDFFDEDVPEKRKRRKKQNESKQRTNSKGIKRPRWESTDAALELATGEPAAAPPQVVVWRSDDRHLPASIPVFNHGETEKVALLKDWRDRYIDFSALSAFPLVPPGRPSKPGFAVVIEQRDSYSCDRLRAPPPDRKESKPEINGASDTSTPQFTNGSHAISSATQETDHAASVSKKRKETGSNIDGCNDDNEEDEEEDSLDVGAPPLQKKKPSSKNRNSAPISKSPARTARTKKRKAMEDEEEGPNDPQPPAAKRKAPSSKAADATAGPGRRTNQPTRTSSRKK